MQTSTQTLHTAEMHTGTIEPQSVESPVPKYYAEDVPHILGSLRGIIDGTDPTNVNLDDNYAAVRRGLSYLVKDHDTASIYTNGQFAYLVNEFHDVTQAEPQPVIESEDMLPVLTRLKDYPEVAWKLLDRHFKLGWRPEAIADSVWRSAVEAYINALEYSYEPAPEPEVEKGIGHIAGLAGRVLLPKFCRNHLHIRHQQGHEPAEPTEVAHPEVAAV